MSAIAPAGSCPPRPVKETNLDDRSHAQNKRAMPMPGNLSQDGRKYYVPFSAEEASGTQAYGNAFESNPTYEVLNPTAHKVMEFHCNKCRQLIDNIPSMTTPSLCTIPKKDPQALGPINTPLKLAQAMLKYFGNSSPLGSLLQYYVDSPSSVTAALLKSKVNEAWNQESYDVSHRDIPILIHRDNLPGDSNTDDTRIKVLSCGHFFHYGCLKEDTDCSMSTTCAEVAELFGRQVLVMSFNQAPPLQSRSPIDLGEEKPATCYSSSLRQQLWGPGSVTKLSDWKKCWGRRAVSLLTVAAGISTVVALQLRKTTSSDEPMDSDCVYDPALQAAYQNLIPSMNTLSYLNQTAKGAYTQLKGLNATSCDTMVTVSEKVVNYLDANGISAACKQVILPMINPLAILSLTSQAVDVMWYYLSTAQTNNACTVQTTLNTPPQAHNSSLMTSITTSPTAPPLPTTTKAQSFLPGGIYYVDAMPWGITTGDFNGDSKPDLAVTNSGSNDISILLGQGDGTFGATAYYALSGISYGIATGDFNGDSKPDLAVISSGVSILLGNGDGTFGAAVYYPVGTAPKGIAIGDFNGDGKADLAMTGSGASILLGKGDGTFGAAVNYGTSAYDQIATGDFNGDGKADLAMTGSGASILLGKGDGTFGAAVNYAVSGNLYEIATGDFNGDGKLDLATTISGSSAAILLGNGDGTFQTAVNYRVGPFNQEIAIGDFNGDGKPDLAITHFYMNTVSISLGKGDGAFGAAVYYPVGKNPWGIATADFNGDGKPDLATANYGADSVSILINS